MAKDDYAVIVYYLLSYLYCCLKHGEQPDAQYLGLKEYPATINEQYLTFIYGELLRKGYITGVIVGDVAILGKGRVKVLKSYEDAQITADGIEYLQQNSTMSLAWKRIQEIGGILLEAVNAFQ